MSGLKFRGLPAELKNDVVKRSPPDKLGRIALRRFSGVETSPAVVIMKKFHERVKSFEDLAEKLEASGKLTEEDRAFVEAILDPKNKTKALARVIVETGARPSRLLKLYAEGAIALGKLDAAIEVAENQPALVKDLLRNALDREGCCSVCLGSGKVKKRMDSSKSLQTCPMCDGSGRRMIPSKNKQFAVEKVLELGQLAEKKPSGSSVNVNVQNNTITGSGAFFSKMLKSTDEILYRQRFKELSQGEGEVVEAQIVGGEKDVVS